MSTISRLTSRFRSAVDKEAEILRYLDAPHGYEPILHDAVSAYAKNATYGSEWKRWRGLMMFFLRMGYLDLPKVRERLEEIHTAKERQFRMVVLIEYPDNETSGWLQRRRWGITMFDANGGLVAKFNTLDIDYGRVAPSGLCRLWFQHYPDAVTLVVTAPDGTEDPPIERGQYS